MNTTPSEDDLIGVYLPPPKPHRSVPRHLTMEERGMLAVILREEKRLKARENLQDFIEYMMPDPNAPDWKKQARVALAKAGRLNAKFHTS